MVPLSHDNPPVWAGNRLHGQLEHNTSPIGHTSNAPAGFVNYTLSPDGCSGGRWCVFATGSRARTTATHK